MKTKETNSREEKRLLPSKGFRTELKMTSGNQSRTEAHQEAIASQNFRILTTRYGPVRLWKMGKLGPAKIEKRILLCLCAHTF